MIQHQSLSSTVSASLEDPLPIAKDNSQHSFRLAEAVRFAVVVLAAVAVRSHLWEPFKPASLAGVLGVIVGGWPIFKEAGENLSAGRMTMELSMSIAIVAAAGIGDFFTALVITLFV